MFQLIRCRSGAVTWPTSRGCAAAGVRPYWRAVTRLLLSTESTVIANVSRRNCIRLAGDAGSVRRARRRHPTPPPPHEPGAVSHRFLPETQRSATPKIQVDNTTHRRCGLDVETLLETFQTVPESLAAAKQDRDHGDMHLIDEVGVEELPDRGGATSDSHIAAPGEFTRVPERGGGLGVQEVEGRTSVQLENWSSVMGEDHHGGVERRIITPPPAPLFILWPSRGCEFVAAHDLGADSSVPSTREHLVDAHGPPLFPVQPHLLEGPRGQGPFE